MTDPLSVAASVAGLVTISSQLFIIVRHFVDSAKDAPALARTVCSEIHAFQTSISSLANILSNSAFRVERGSLIAADNIVATLTDAVLLFSELDCVVKPLLEDTGKSQSLRMKTRWAQNKSKILELVNRLQWHKHTLSLQLSIIQCSSDLEARAKADSLEQTVAKKLANDLELSRRLTSLEQSLYARSNYPYTEMQSSDDVLSIETVRAEDRTLGASSTTLQYESFGSSDDPPDMLVPVREFEYVLKNSWVYSRTLHRDESMSIARPSCRTGPMSMLSQISLSQISIVSVIALPLDPTRLANVEEYKLNSDASLTLRNMDDHSEIAPKGILTALEREIDRLPSLILQTSYTSIDSTSSQSKLSLLLPRSLRPKIGRISEDVQALASYEERLRFDWAWKMFDRNNTGWISKATFPRLLAELSGAFSVGIYSTSDHFAVRSILGKCPQLSSLRQPLHMVDSIRTRLALEELNTALRNLPVDEMRTQRWQFTLFCEEVLACADPDRGVSKRSVQVILLHHKQLQRYQSASSAERIRHYLRMVRARDTIRREIVRGFFDVLYFQRRLRRDKVAKKQGTLSAPYSDQFLDAEMVTTVPENPESEGVPLANDTALS